MSTVASKEELRSSMFSGSYNSLPTVRYLIENKYRVSSMSYDNRLEKTQDLSR